MKCLPALILAVLLAAAEGKALPAGENQQAATQTFQLPTHLRQEAERVLNNFNQELVKEISNLKEETPKEGSPSWVRDFRTLVRNIINEMKTTHPENNSFWINLKTEMTVTMNNTNINQTGK